VPLGFEVIIAHGSRLSKSSHKKERPPEEPLRLKFRRGLTEKQAIRVIEPSLGKLRPREGPDGKRRGFEANIDEFSGDAKKYLTI
jgi:hypothetical protein